jgi:hypothetical protein
MVWSRVLADGADQLSTQLSPQPQMKDSLPLTGQRSLSAPDVNLDVCRLCFMVSMGGSPNNATCLADSRQMFFRNACSITGSCRF